MAAYREQNLYEDTAITFIYNYTFIRDFKNNCLTKMKLPEKKVN